MGHDRASSIGPKQCLSSIHYGSVNPSTAQTAVLTPLKMSDMNPQDERPDTGVKVQSSADPEENEAAELVPCAELLS